MNKKELGKTYKHWLTGDGLFHNVDGSVSDRWVLAYIIICISLLVIFIWAFGKEPKPEYAYKLLSMYISIVLPILITGQSAENYFRRKGNRDSAEENNNNGVNVNNGGNGNDN